MRNQDDRDLRDLFLNLQNVDGDQVPDFRTMMNKARDEASRSGPEIHPEARNVFPFSRKLAWGGSFMAAAAAAVLLLIQIPGSSDSEFVHVVQTFSSDPAGGAWTSPTDGLLNLPGSEILSTVPSIGSGRLLSDPGGRLQRNEL